MNMFVSRGVSVSCLESRRVMCDPYTPAGVPIPTNKRHNAAKIFRHPSLPPRSLVRKIHINWTIATKKNRITGSILSKEIKPLISTVFEGKDANVIAHGARNCGKTHLIHGNDRELGLTVLTMSEMLSMAVSVSVSVYEVPMKSLSEFHKGVMIHVTTGNANPGSLGRMNFLDMAGYKDSDRSS
ncbi:unnamed protein product [Arabidopsis lyrata]|nr:unnamed protein product [Arabidopsis lyrata]